LKELTMLILTLGEAGDEAVITTPAGDEIVVRVLDRAKVWKGPGVERNVRVGFEAPRFIKILRRPRTKGERKSVAGGVGGGK
jgi:sRNA-binding carbon storage regulator CsrA